MQNNTIKQTGLNESKDLAMHYMQTLIEVARESFLILDSSLRVISANPTFYSTFQVSPEETESKFVNELGNGQWSIPELKKLLEEILPKKKVVKDYEVTHVFEGIGKKTMLLNARQIDSVQLLILAIEDVTGKKSLEEKLAEYTRSLEVRVRERTEELGSKVKELEAINKTMVGRETQMIELKRQLEDIRKSK